VSRYRVEVARRALKAIAALPRKDQLRVRAAIDLLADNPRPPGCVALAGEPHAYRVRTGDYRIVYEVFDNHRKLLLVKRLASLCGCSALVFSALRSGNRDGARHRLIGLVRRGRGGPGLSPSFALNAGTGSPRGS
jgi:mRNA interferase RelE/StbE